MTLCPPTKGTWFAAYGSVYSLLEDGSVVRVSLMDREEPGTTPTERDANARYIAGLQNNDTGRKMNEEDFEEAFAQIG